MSSFEPELWVDEASAAVDFYVRALGATVLHRVGDGDDIVCQLGVGAARFWVTAADASRGRLSPAKAGGTTGRTLLVVEDPAATAERVAAAGAELTSPVSEEHGWLLGRIVDPFGHEWEIGRPVGDWPPA